MDTIAVNIRVPESWSQLSDKQLLYAYKLIAGNFHIDTIKTLCFIYWSGLKLIGKSGKGSYVFQYGKEIFELTPLSLAELATSLDWLSEMPPQPVRPARIGRCCALPADFSGVPFETYIIVDNLYQGYLQTHDDSLLDQIAMTVYSRPRHPLLHPSTHQLLHSNACRIAVFYWVVSLKDFFTRRYCDLYSVNPSGENGNLLGGAQPSSVEDAMNAQIRALTKGDITKEKEILALDTWRALTELNSQAREYKEMNEKLNAAKK